ncbi:hypothetical protein [Methanohalobium evestigatum]|nr:hypothetical protein [Methanohalobium evestigatum]
MIDYMGSYSSFRVALNYYVKKGYVNKIGCSKPYQYNLTKKGVKHAYNPFLHRNNFYSFVEKKANEKAIKLLEDDNRIKEIVQKLVDDTHEVNNNFEYMGNSLFNENRKLKNEIYRLKFDRNLKIEKVKVQTQNEILNMLGYNNLNELYSNIKGHKNKSKLSETEFKRRMNLIKRFNKRYITKQFFDELKYYKPYFSPSTFEIKILPISYGKQVVKDGFFRELNANEILKFKMYVIVSSDEGKFSIISQKIGKLADINLKNNTGKQQKRKINPKDRS